MPRWIQWAGDKTTISWPPNHGGAAVPEGRGLAAGALIPRTGIAPFGEPYRTAFLTSVARPGHKREQTGCQTN